MLHVSHIRTRQLVTIMNAVVLFAAFFVYVIHPASAVGGFSQGRQFMLTFMHDHHTQSNNSNNFLYISSNEFGTAYVEVAGDGTVPFWRNSYTIKAGKTVKVSLPKQSNMSNVTYIEKKGILVSSGIDLTVYAVSIHPQTGSADAAVILPVTSLSTHYVIPSVRGNPVMAIAAVKDTVATVEVLSSCPVHFHGRGLHGSTNVTLRMAEFDVFQMFFSNQSQCDFGGTRVKTSRPVAVFSGSSCDVSLRTCGYSMMQVVPVELWGLRYIVPDLAAKGDYRVRIVSSVDSPNINVYEHHSDHTIHHYEIEMDGGSTRDVSVPDGTILEVFANRGIHVTQFDSGPASFSIPISPVESYGWNYTISTMDASLLHDYNNYVNDTTTLNVVAHRDSAKTLTVDGNLVHPSSWRRVHDLGFSVAAIPVSKGNHILRADDNFMVQVYGYNGVGSYGYLAGYHFKTLPSEHLSAATANQPTMTTTETTITTWTTTTSTSLPPVASTHTPCRDHPGLNCGILHVSLHICTIPKASTHYCRKYCRMC